MAKEQTSYTSASIKTLRFPENVRANVGMYLGATDAHGLWVAVREPLDNAIDEYLAGRGSSVHLHVADDGSYWVVDDADGVPQGYKKYPVHIDGKEVEIKTPTMQSVFGELNTSGKYNDEAYAISRGTHGVGVKSTNATAEFFNVTTFHKGSWYSIGFRNGVLKSPVAATKAPVLWDGKTATKGTVVHFKPDPKIFSAKTFAASVAVQWAELAAYLTPGFKVTISSKKGKREFVSEKGPIEYVQAQMTKANVAGETRMFAYKSVLADVLVAFTNYDGCAVKGFVNGLGQEQGGKHVDSVVGALYAGLKPFIKVRKIKEKGKSKDVPLFREADLREGLMGLVNMYLHKATYSSQDKSKLTDDRAGPEFEAVLVKEATKFFADNKALAQRLCERATKLNELKTKFSLSKNATKALNAMRRGGLPAKFASWDTRTKPQDRELFIVEGDSAAGTVKEARFPYQGVLPLKGKIMNALKDPNGKALDSDEIISILACIGIDPNATDPYGKLQVGKIVNLADPDPDGSHINSLLLGLFYKYLPDLYERGMINIANAPEFYAEFKVGKNQIKLVVGSSVSEVQEKLSREDAPASTAIRHVKGYGELDADKMRFMVMSPTTRRMTRIKPIEHEDRTDFVRLMNDDVEYRREMLGLPSGSDDATSVEQPTPPVKRAKAKQEVSA
jgi:DNA gyrase/topoisomerase IV subunit B